MLERDACYWIERLELEPHPEGGFFRETYRAGRVVGRDALPPGYRGDRSHCTAIYYLLRSHDVSTFHRMLSDEVFHHYAGAALTVHVIDTEDRYEALGVGTNLERGEAPQRLVRGGCWFGATVDAPETYSLVGCTVSPGFDFAEFEQAERRAMLERYPQLRQIVERLT